MKFGERCGAMIISAKVVKAPVIPQTSSDRSCTLTRFAVKLDFLAGLLAKALRATGGDAFRGNQAALGEVIALRHMFWSFSHAMAHNPIPWANGAVLPNLEAALAYRTFMSEAYPRVIDTVRRVIASG